MIDLSVPYNQIMMTLSVPYGNLMKTLLVPRDKLMRTLSVSYNITLCCHFDRERDIALCQNTNIGYLVFSEWWTSNREHNPDNPLTLCS